MSDLNCRQFIAAALGMLFAALQVHGADSYTTASRELSVPSLQIGSVTFSDVVLAITPPLVSGPSGTVAIGSGDLYDPATRQLIVPMVSVMGGDTYYNVIATGDHLISMGGVSGADTFDGTTLWLHDVQLGAQSYHGVSLRVGVDRLLRVGGGLPQVDVDQYDVTTGQLTIGAVQVAGGNIHTNVVVTASLHDVVAVGGYTDKILASFPTGSGPSGGLIMDANGSLYGTAVSGPGAIYGGVFKLTPIGNGNYTERGLYSFKGGADGLSPLAGLVTDATGNLYGTTHGFISASPGADPASNYGTVFRLSPDGSGGYTESVLYTFQGAADGGNPQAGALIIDANGALYGTTSLGGLTVFKLTPNGTGAYAESVLHQFPTGPTGPYPPAASLTMDATGNLYGTIYNGPGTSSVGSVFKLTADGSGGYAASILYSFQGGAGGAYPAAGLLLDANGSLYGTTESGGGASDAGTVFVLTPNLQGGYNERVLYSFKGGADGAYPFCGLVQDAGGNLYGTTSGWILPTLTNGTVFKLIPDGSGGYNEVMLHNFQGGTDGAAPQAGLLMDASGDLYGTAPGTNTAAGVVFRIQ